MNVREQRIKKILEETGMSGSELRELVQEKKEELKGLISDEGAIYLIYRELGFEADPEFQHTEGVKIKKLVSEQMSDVPVSGKIEYIREIHTFTRKNGTLGKVGNFTLSDETSRINVVVWDDKTDIFQDPKFKAGTQIFITDGMTKFSDYRNKYEFIVSKSGKISFQGE